MNRRSLIKSGMGLLGAAALAPTVIASTEKENDTLNYAVDHICGDVCFEGAEQLARAIINDTGVVKKMLHDWTKRSMVVTRHGQEACEIILARQFINGTLIGTSWVYQRRSLTADERRSFREEYGRAHWLVLGMEISSQSRIRGFILNGRRDGWNVSVSVS